MNETPITGDGEFPSDGGEQFSDAESWAALGDTVDDIEAALAALNVAWADSQYHVRQIWSSRVRISSDEAWLTWAGWIGTQILHQRQQDFHKHRSAIARDPEKVRRYKARAAGMAARYRAGATLAEIGEEHGLSRERVRQILKAYGVEMGWSVRRVHLLQAREAALQEIVAVAQEYLLANGPTQRKDLIAAVPGLTSLHIGEALRRGLLPRNLVLNTVPVAPEPPSFEESVAAVRRIWLESGQIRLSAERYSADRTSHDPRVSYIIHRWSWAAVCEAAGMGPQGGLARGVKPKWTDDDVLEWVARYLRWTARENRDPTTDGYEQWARTQAGAPLPATVRNRLQVHLQMGTWPEVLQAVASQNSIVADLSATSIGDTISPKTGRDDTVQGRASS